MTYYKNALAEEQYLTINPITLLKDNLKSNINSIQKRLIALLKRKNRVDLHPGVSSEETVSISNEDFSLMQEDSLSMDRISNISLNDTESTITIHQDIYQDDSESTITIEQDMYQEDSIDDLIEEKEENTVKFYKVKFKNGDYGWISEDQISEDLLQLWKNKLFQ